MAIIPIIVITKNIDVIDKEHDNLDVTNIAVGPSAPPIIPSELLSFNFTLYLYIKYIGNRYSQIPPTRAIIALTTVIINIILDITKFLCLLVFINNPLTFPKFVNNTYYIIYCNYKKQESIKRA